MLTGPLPEQVDHRRLAADKAQLDGQIPVASFQRLSGMLENSTGELSVRLSFKAGKKHRTFVVGACEGNLVMTCQQCLEPVTIETVARIRTLLVASSEELDELEQDEDGIVVAGDEVQLVELLEDDMILALPMVPRHMDGECAMIDIEPLAEPATASHTHRPFAGLKEHLSKD